MQNTWCFFLGEEQADVCCLDQNIFIEFHATGIITTQILHADVKEIKPEEFSFCVSQTGMIARYAISHFVILSTVCN